MIGEQELERPRVSTTASVQSYGRDSLNYAPDLERSLVVNKEQIMALPNLYGYWKYGDAIVPFRIEPQERRPRARAFVPRQSRQMNQPELPKELSASPTPAAGNGHKQERNAGIEILTDDTGELERRF
jgi:hypothetical protein